MTRLEALEAVAAAARQVAECDGKGFSMGELRQALAALDAPDTADETVTLQAFEDPEDGEWRFVRINTNGIGRFRKNGWKPVGTVTLPLDRERGE